jgi:hypothetical protein
VFPLHHEGAEDGERLRGKFSTAWRIGTKAYAASIWKSHPSKIREGWATCQSFPQIVDEPFFQCCVFFFWLVSLATGALSQPDHHGDHPAPA